MGDYLCPCRNPNYKEVLYQAHQIGTSSYYQDEVKSRSIYRTECEENCIEISHVSTMGTLEAVFTKKKKIEGKKKQSLCTLRMV